VTPAVVLVVKSTVAIPLPLVALVADANEPPVPVLPHVTMAPDVATALPFASASCAEIVTTVPATGLDALGVTTYFVGGPATVITPLLEPLRAAPSTAVKEYVTPAVVPVVNVTVATPLAFVVLVAEAKEPPAPVLDQVTTCPERFSGAPFASTTCAVTVIGAPAAIDGALVVTVYFEPVMLMANGELVALENPARLAERV
jgi:hypothetical protein